MVKHLAAKKPRVLKDETVPESPPSNMADRETFHWFLGRVVAKKATLDAHRKEMKAIRREAQDAGIVLKDLDHVLRLREEEPETVQEGLRRLVQYANWVGLAPGTQTDLFKDVAPKVDAEEKAYQEGKIDGLEGVSAQGERYDTANPLGQARLRGWNDGQKVIYDRFLSKQPAAETVQ
jgi:hypothetical protein